MSSVRVGRPQQHTKGKRPVRPKRVAAPKKDWVSTVNDLSVHKLTPAEVSHRHEIHKSHNKAAAQWELREKALKRHFGHRGSPAPLDQASINIIREVFSDQLLLQDVLARSDRAMAVVKNLFGDAPKRQSGHPSVTMAPSCDSDSPLPDLQRPDPPTQMSLLSQSVMDQQALNEVNSLEEEYSDEDICLTGSSDYHVIQRANLQKMKAQSRGGLIQQQKSKAKFRQADRDDVPVTPCTSGRAPDQTALNATVAVQRVQSRQSQSDEGKDEPSVLVSQVLNPDLPLSRIRSHTSRTTKKCVSPSLELNGSSVASLSGDQSSLGLLQAMLGQVDADLDTLRPETEPASTSQKAHTKQGLTGFSVALVSTLGRIVHLVKQREEEAQKEAVERKRLEEQLGEQRTLIDALSGETMTLREEIATMQAGLQQQTAELMQKLDTVMFSTRELGLLAACESDVRAAVCQSAPGVERVPQHRQASASPAALLSPPQQGENWKQIPVTHPAPPQQDHLCVNASHSFRDAQPRSSASSVTSLSLCNLPNTSSSSMTSELSPETMLAEIAQLSRENEMIKSQLRQAREHGSRLGGLPSNGRRRLSSISTGRVVPQSVGEKSTSLSNCTVTKCQVQAAEGHKLTHQESSPSHLSVSSVEQRLLEVNRQSAAARSRLLELIEQQRQNVTANVSPCDSPIPPSAFSPPAAGGGGSPEESMVQSEQDIVAQTGGHEKRSPASEMFSQSLGRETRNGSTQMERRRPQEGWFSLSSNVGL